MSSLDTVRQRLADKPELLAQFEALVASGALDHADLSDLDLETAGAGKGPVVVAVGPRRPYWGPRFGPRVGFRRGFWW